MDSLQLLLFQSKHWHQRWRELNIQENQFYQIDTKVKQYIYPLMILRFGMEILQFLVLHYKHQRGRELNIGEKDEFH